MDYRYRSPLEGSYYDDDQCASNGRRSWPPPQRPPAPNFHNRTQYHPYARPSTSSSQGQSSYSSRYKLSSYPKELNDLFGALECRLCCVEVSSPIVAKMHYSGKQHMKKVKNYLMEWCERTGNPMPDIADSLPQSSSILSDYCELCNVTLTSVNDKLLHFSGKNHRKNEKDPENAKKKKKTYDIIDLSSTDSRFGIGLEFKPSEIMELEEVKLAPFICEICDVKAVSQEQLQIHLNGKKHKEKVEKKNSVVPKAVNPSVSILASVAKDQPRESVDYSMHRTPSERPFKCELCDVSLETKNLYKLHLEGKRHLKNMTKGDLQNTASCTICNVTFTSFDQYDAHMLGKKHEKKCKQFYNKTLAVKDEKVTIACKFCPFVGNLENHNCDESILHITPEDSVSVKKWYCVTCHNMAFDSEQALHEHKSSRRHLICMLNTKGDKVIEEYKHWYCFVCRKQYRNHRDYTNHLFEPTHMTLTSESSDLGSKVDLFHCAVCDVMMDKAAKDEHMVDKRHLKESARKDTWSILTTLANSDLGTNNFKCSNCDIKFCSFTLYSEHLLGEDHLERMVCSKLASHRNQHTDV